MVLCLALCVCVLKSGFLGVRLYLEQTYCSDFIPFFNCWVSQTKGISSWQHKKWVQDQRISYHTQSAPHEVLSTFKLIFNYHWATLWQVQHASTDAWRHRRKVKAWESHYTFYRLFTGSADEVRRSDQFQKLIIDRFLSPHFALCLGNNESFSHTAPKSLRQYNMMGYGDHLTVFRLALSTAFFTLP